MKYWLEPKSKPTNFHGIFHFNTVRDQSDPFPVFLGKLCIVVGIKCWPLFEDIQYENIMSVPYKAGINKEGKKGGRERMESWEKKWHRKMVFVGRQVEGGIGKNYTFKIPLHFCFGKQVYRLAFSNQGWYQTTNLIILLILYNVADLMSIQSIHVYNLLVVSIFKDLPFIISCWNCHDSFFQSL